MGRERLEMTDLRERRGRAFAEEVRARSPLALPELEWESVPVRLVLKIVFISLEALESPEADLFTVSSDSFREAEVSGETSLQRPIELS